MTPPDALPPGMVTEPHTAHVVASYVLTAVGMAALSVWAWASSRRWAARQKAATAQEAALKERADG